MLGNIGGVNRDFHPRRRRPAMADLKAQFEQAVADSQEPAGKARQHDPAASSTRCTSRRTGGDVDGKRPGFADMVGRAKWDAWNDLKGKSSDEAMQEYVDLVESLKESRRPALLSEDGRFAASTAPRTIAPATTPTQVVDRGEKHLQHAAQAGERRRRSRRPSRSRVRAAARRAPGCRRRPGTWPRCRRSTAASSDRRDGQDRPAERRAQNASARRVSAQPAVVELDDRRRRSRRRRPS